jgi:competence protein ComEC
MRSWIWQRVHVSWSIAITGLGFVGGVSLSLLVQTSGWLALALGMLLLLAGFVAGRRWAIVLVMLGGIVLGVCYGSVALGERSVYEKLVDGGVTLEGSVKEDPTTNERRQLVMQLNQIKIGDQSLAGSVWASTSTAADIKRGDRVAIVGEVSPGFGTYPASLPSATITSVTRPFPGDIGRVIRDWFAAAVRTVVPEPQASLGIGYLTGQKSALPPDLAEALQIAGLSHIVVASGYNLTILVRLSRRLFARISRYVSAAASGMLVASFMLITGLSPSMTRAGLVSGLSLLAWYYGRSFHPFVLLPFAAAITVLWEPSYAWGDIGWLLSFSAFGGVMIVAPLLQQYLFGDKKPGVLRQVLGETAAAHLVTLPIVVVAFGVLSNVAVPANLLIVPLVPLAMLLTFITGIAALTIPFIAELVALPTTWLLSYMTRTAEFFAGLPWAQIELAAPWWAIALYCTALTAACLWVRRATKLDLREVSIID